jgi:hypothetical protein
MFKKRIKNFLQLVWKIFKPRFSFHYIAYTILFLVVALSLFRLVFATTPNPGHPWTDLGDGTFIVTGPTVARTYTFPDANATILTSNGLVTVAQGGIGVGTLASNGVLYGNGAGAVQTLAVNSGAVQCLTQASSGAPLWSTCGGGSGTVTAVSVTTANGVSGSVATSTTTPAITLTLGAITPISVNGLTISSSTGTLSITNAKTLAVSNSLTFAGTDGTTITLPSTSATLARTDAANTFTGHQTVEGVTSAGATGTGKFVFDTSPTLVTPVLGVASGTSLALTSSESITATSTPTADMLALSNSGQATTTNDANGLKINYFANQSTNSNQSSAEKIVLTNTSTTANTITNGLKISTTSSAATQTTNGILIDALTAGPGTETGINIGAGWDTGLSISQSGTGIGALVNTSGTGSLLELQSNSVDVFSVLNTGGLTINGSDSSTSRTSTADFALGTVGSSLANSGGRLQLSDGTPANSGQGTITTSSQPAVDASVAAGAMTIARADGKYLLIKGGSTGATSVYDSVAGTFTNAQTIVCNGTTTVGVGAIALPRPSGIYTLICGVAASTTTATSNIDPMGNVQSTIGPALTIAFTGAGGVAYKRPDGKYLVTVGASTPTGTTQIFDPVANTFVIGPSASSGTWTTGSLTLPRPDGQALIINGGATSTTNIYNPNGVSATIGTFTTGPSLDGKQTAGTCGINGSGSVAIKRQDGKYIILSKASVEAVYDPSANTMTCTSSISNVSALGDGAHAIPLQNGKFLILAGGVSTTAFVYNQDSDTFSTYLGTTPSTVGTGAHSILRTDGTWQIIAGNSGTTTNNFSTALPMSDPFPSQISAAIPTSGGLCDAGMHSYYVTFIGAAESELSIKSAIISCTAGNGTVALSNIPIGPTGTTARKIYRTTAGDTGLPKLLNTIADNTTVIFSDTVADASLGSTYSVTASPTWYTSEDISSGYVGTASSIRWTAQMESVYAAMRNGVNNTAFKVVQFYVKTAVNSSGCSGPLASAQWQEIQNPGDSIRAVPGASCVKIAVHFNRAMPKKLFDDRGVFTGNNTTVLRYDYTTPTLYDFTIDNSAVVKKNAFDFSTPNSTAAVTGTVPTAPTSGAPAGTSGACTNGNHFWFVSFVQNGVESQLSTASTVQSCSGSNQTETLTIPIGPSGTTARKIYRTAAGYLVTDTPFLVGTQSDNSTTSYADALADTSLSAAFGQLTSSGPILTRAESTRVEAISGHLTLPYGRIASTVMNGTTGFYQGVFSAAHPNLNNAAGIGTFVIARDDKTFLVVEAGNTSATADVYDPATQTFINQSGTGNVPTVATGSGAFAIKRPDGKFLVVIGGGSSVTNVYDQYAPPGHRFTAGPSITGTAANQGAFAIQNTDGTYTILPGNAATSTSIYDPVRSTMSVGPLQTTGTNISAMAIPLSGPLSGVYKVTVGVATLTSGVNTATMNYNSNNKIFTAGTALASGVGSGAFAFQRQDGIWIIIRGDATGTVNTATGILNPSTGIEAVGVTLGVGVDRGTHVIPRADGTFLIVNGSLANGATVTTNIYLPTSGIASATIGVIQGTFLAAGPSAVLQGGITAPAALTTAAPGAGGSCDTGTHLWRYSYLQNGIESTLSPVGTVQSCITGTTGTEALTGVTIGPTGTTSRRIYRSKANATGPFYLAGTIADNVTTTFSDSVADASLTTINGGGGPAEGAIAFQRPDGKFVEIFGGNSYTTNLYDAGWYSDGQYLSEEMNVPAMAANSTLDWQQTPDQYVRMSVRTAASQTTLGVASYRSISSPGGSVENAANDTWAQVQANFRRDFPTYPGINNGVYNTSGFAYPYRTISLPTVNSYQISNGMDLLTLQTNGINAFRVTSNGSILSSSLGGFFSGGADLAENYTSTQKLEKGEVVAIDPHSSAAVLRSTSPYQNSILGIVSTTPGFVAGSYTADSYPIALVGRVPVKVSTENGNILAGDYITAASVPGYAMRATVAGRVLGKALENLDTSKLDDCPVGGSVSIAKCGTVMVFVNLVDYTGAPIDMLVSEFENIQKNNINNLGVSLDSGLVDHTISLDASGNTVVTPSVTVNSTQKYEDRVLAFLNYTKQQRQGNVNNLSQLFTDRVAAAMEILSPQIFANGLTVDSISSSKDAIALMSDTIFFGRPYFSTDTAGFAIIKKGSNSVDITFDRNYLEQPIVNASITLDTDLQLTKLNPGTDASKIKDIQDKQNQDIQNLFNTDLSYLIVNKSEKGFTIILKHTAESDIRFSWITLAVKGAKTFSSLTEGIIPEIVPVITTMPNTVPLLIDTIINSTKTVVNTPPVVIPPDPVVPPPNIPILTPPVVIPPDPVVPPPNIPILTPPVVIPSDPVVPPPNSI